MALVSLSSFPFLALSMMEIQYSDGEEFLCVPRSVCGVPNRYLHEGEYLKVELRLKVKQLANELSVPTETDDDDGECEHDQEIMEAIAAYSYLYQHCDSGTLMVRFALSS